MTKEEIAMQITLKAIECKAIKLFDSNPQSGKTAQETIEFANEHNAAAISKFYSEIYKTLAAL